MEALASSEKACEAKVLSSAKAKVTIPVNFFVYYTIAAELQWYHQFNKPLFL